MNKTRNTKASPESYDLTLHGGNMKDDDLLKDAFWYPEDTYLILVKKSKKGRRRKFANNN
jgi:hypothetical protein